MKPIFKLKFDIKLIKVIKFSEITNSSHEMVFRFLSFNFHHVPVELHFKCIKVVFGN